MIETMCDKTTILHYNSNINGPTILLLGGTHGNEPASSHILEQIINELNNGQIVIKKGKLIIIPHVNSCGLNLNSRYAPFTDINRNYPVEVNGKTKYKINSEIINLVKDSDFIIDLHEGWGYHKINKASMGSTLYPSKTSESIKTSDILTKYINMNIVDNTKHFTSLIDPKCEIKGSLHYFANISNKNYILIETTGQNDIQPMNIRVQQGYDIIYYFLHDIYNLI